MTGAVRPNFARRRLVVVLVLLVIVGVIAGIWIAAASAGRDPAAPPASASPVPTSTPTSTASAAPTPTPEPPIAAPAVPAPSCDPNDVGALINKRNPICPIDYVPDLVTVASTGGELRPEAAAAMDALVGTMQAETGLTIFSASAYRSYDTQVTTYGGWVDQDGQAAADRYSARPGHSEHQTGLAIDVGASSCGCTDEPFGHTPESDWIVANAWKFGYIVRYPDGYESTTGYIWEPWHLRYVGPAIAAAMHDGGIPTLEDYYGTGPAPDYG